MTFHTYANDFTVSAKQLDDAQKPDLVAAAKRQMRRDVDRFNDARIAPFGFDHTSFMPSVRRNFDDIARRTSEFRKLRLTADDWLGPGAQVCEAEHVPETDSKGVPACWSGGGGVAIASTKVVTEMRFDAWMARLEGVASDLKVIPEPRKGGRS